ncbi:MAG: nitroreductase family protein [Ignavibacteriae bacterium]|nr:nitroreductase family protein [Ignavibacteriota bacterium]
MLKKAEIFNNLMQERRTVREFSTKPFSEEIIKSCVHAANSAPSGANKQPWHFVIVNNSEIKKQIRIEAEKEEREFYNNRASNEWLKDLEPFETNDNKPFLEEAPYLIVIFEEKYSFDKNDKKSKNYYVKESVGIATGILITALHNCGLVSLTHTPSPMNFLNKILQRPKNEKPFLLLVVGYPKEGTLVPNIERKSFDEIATIL